MAVRSTLPVNDTLCLLPSHTTWPRVSYTEIGAWAKTGLFFMPLFTNVVVKLFGNSEGGPNWVP
jgi:hypothetical protein